MAKKLSEYTGIDTCTQARVPIEKKEAIIKKLAYLFSYVPGVLFAFFTVISLPYFMFKAILNRAFTNTISAEDFLKEHMPKQTDTDEQS